MKSGVEINCQITRELARLFPKWMISALNTRVKKPNKHAAPEPHWAKIPNPPIWDFKLYLIKICKRWCVIFKVHPGHPFRSSHYWSYQPVGAPSIRSFRSKSTDLERWNHVLASAVEKTRSTHGWQRSKCFHGNVSNIEPNAELSPLTLKDWREKPPTSRTKTAKWHTQFQEKDDQKKPSPKRQEQAPAKISSKGRLNEK
jgi:hypothetical protein